jgi:hypothetical protein
MPANSKHRLAHILVAMNWKNKICNKVLLHLWLLTHPLPTPTCIISLFLFHADAARARLEKKAKVCLYECVPL